LVKARRGNAVPAKPKSKGTINELSSYSIYGNKEGDSFFIPTTERLQKINQFWNSDKYDLSTLTPNDLSVSIQNAAGYNNGRSFARIDVDDSNLRDAF
jgi:hypothetical protein